VLTRHFPPPHRSEFVSLETASGAVLDTGFREVCPAARKVLEQLAAEGGRRDGLIDWARGLNPDNPAELDDEVLAIYSTPLWRDFSREERTQLRRHYQAFLMSQSLHGKQASMMFAARLMESAPMYDVKRFAALQAADDARHAKHYQRLLTTLGIVYPPTSGLREFVEAVLKLERWDLVLLSSALFFKCTGLTLAQVLRDISGPSLVREINAVVMLEQSRHTVFGRKVLEQVYADMSEEDRATAEALVELWSDAFYHQIPLSPEIAETLGYPPDAMMVLQDTSELMAMFRALLFQRLVPSCRAINLWTPKVISTFERLDVAHYADVDIDTFLAADRRAVEELQVESL